MATDQQDSQKGLEGVEGSVGGVSNYVGTGDDNSFAVAVDFNIMRGVVTARQIGYGNSVAGETRVERSISVESDYTDVVEV